MTSVATQPWYQLTEEVAAQIPSPALLISPEMIRKNLEEMIRWCGNGGANQLRPHVKTHKMPRIVQMKSELGIHKFKCSTIAEAEMTASAGGDDVLLALQPVGPNVLRLFQLKRKFPTTNFSTIVDNLATAKRLSETALSFKNDLEVFVDLNLGMDRTGVSPSEAFELYCAIAELPGLRSAGLHAYDGHLHETDAGTLKAKLMATFEPVWKLKEQLETAGYSVPKIAGCGTPTSMLAAENFDIEVSAGTSVLWDAGQPQLSPPMKIGNAIALLCRVISQPTDDSICLDLGHKSLASEMPLATPRVRLLGFEDATHIMHNEEHLVVRLSAPRNVEIGTVIYGFPTHVCPTVALHDQAWAIADGKIQDKWSITARTRCISV